VRLQGKTAMVTGAGRGIGEAIAEALAAEGAAVAVCDLDGTAAAKTAAGIAERHGARAVGVGADIADSAAVRAAVSRVASELGPPDILVNNAGIDVVELFVDSAAATWDKIIAVNLRGVFLLCKYGVPHLKRAGGGAIVNLASGAALGGGGGTSYTASKGGVTALTRAVAFQNAAENIRCNSICPGPVDTPMLQISMKKLGLTSMTSRPGTIPRVARPEEVAYLITFLASDEAAYITGATYTIDGGASQH